jgi:hypothetical protein
MRRWMQGVNNVVLGVMFAFVLTGCSSISDYPRDWSPIDKSFRSNASVEQPCPHLVGRFRQSGTISPNNPSEMCSTSSPHYEWALDWLCETSLVRNLAPRESGDKEYAPLVDGEWIELQQPDGDTLRIVSGEPANVSIKLRRSSGDFACRSDGLSRVQHDIWRVTANAGDPGGPEHPVGRVIAMASATLSAPVFVFGGFATLTRTFNLTTDGSLVMKIVHSRKGVSFFIPTYEESSTYVMWSRASEGEGSEGPAPVPLLDVTIGRMVGVAEGQAESRRQAVMADASAQFQIVKMYQALSQVGSIGSYVEAYKWVSIVEATSTDPQMRYEAAEDRNDLAAKMDPAEIAEGERRAREWLDAHHQTNNETSSRH